MFGKIGMALGGCSLVVSAVSLIMSILEKKEMVKKLIEQENELKKTTGNMDRAVKDLAEATPVEIKKELIERAVKMAMDREVQKATKDAVYYVKDDIHREIQKAAKDEVEARREELIGRIDKKLVEEVEKISADDISRDVQKKVVNVVIDRIDDDLDEMKNKYFDKLDQTMKDLEKDYKRKMDLMVGTVDSDYWAWRLRRA